MSMWQWFAAVEGYVAAHSTKEGNRLSADEADALFDWIGQRAANDQLRTLAVHDWTGRQLVLRKTVSFKS